MKEKQNTPPLELRSEKAHRVIGDIPNSLVYWSITILVVIFVLLITVVLCMPYPHSNNESIFQHIFG